MSGKIKVLAVVGPTASGKTALAVELAKRYDGEVVSCDSMQIYRGMTVGTAAATEEERRGIPHHLIGFVSPLDNFSCADYAERAEKSIEDISARGKLPILCGGTGLYLDTVLRGTRLSEAGRDDGYRNELSAYSAEKLHEMLTDIDPESAEKIHANNVKRVIRALEIYRVTGKTKTEWDAMSRIEESVYDAILIGLDFRDREKLYERINRRVDIMLEKGLEAEVRALDCEGFRASTAAQAIGYKEMLRYIDGHVTIEEAAEEIKKASRNYAKRQLTWFRNEPDIRMIYPDECPEDADKFEFIVNSAVNIINII